MARFTRRQFLATGALAGGGLVIGSLLLRPTSHGDRAALAVRGDEVLLNTWVKLAPDGTATIYVPHTEMGQGILTSLPMMLAEEMDLAWEQVVVEQAPCDSAFANADLVQAYVMPGWDVPEPLVGLVRLGTLKIAELMNMQLTGGSTSVRYTGQVGMRRAGAAARAVLLEAGAGRLGVDAAECSTEPGFVVHSASDRRLGYGELAADAAGIAPPKKPVLKDPAAYRLVGTNVPRVDLPSKVDGSAQYGIDARLPGMRYAAIQAAPVFGSTIAAVDAAPALALRGVERVIELEDAVVVVADRYWRAKKGLDALDITWDTGDRAAISSASIGELHDALLADEEKLEDDVETGDAAAAFAAADRVVESRYALPYLAHATMEPMNCTASWKDGMLDVWSGMQNMLTGRAVAAKAAGLPMEQVRVHPVMLGGGFGRRGSNTLDYVEQAVKVALQLEHPVKLVWSREEDIRRDAYRPAVRSRMRAALDAGGDAVAFQHEYIGHNEPVEAAHIPYAIPNQRIRVAPDETHVPFGPWRSVAHSQHAFFSESFADELAHAAGEDPLAWRLARLEARPRLAQVLERVAEMSGWGKPLPDGHALGIAVQESFGSVVAETVEVVIDEDALSVVRVCCAADTGEVIHPDSLEGQLQSGILFGLTAALYGEITIENGAVVQSNFPDYPMLHLAQSPEIEIALMPSGAPIGGAGEIGTPPVAPALANAIFTATGKRLRALPLTRAGFRVV